MADVKLTPENLEKIGLGDHAEFTPAKIQALHAEGGHNADAPHHQGCDQTFEERHCYWCGKPNCVNPAWPIWFCWNGGHPNGG